MVDDESARVAKASWTQTSSITIAGDHQEICRFRRCDNLPFDASAPQFLCACPDQPRTGVSQQLMSGAGQEVIDLEPWVAVRVTTPEEAREGTAGNRRDVLVHHMQQNDVCCRRSVLAGGVDARTPGPLDNPDNDFHDVSLR